MDNGNQNIQWHPAFCAAICLELVQNKTQLDFNKEYNINRKPLQLDLLVVKKSEDVLIENEIGKIFRIHNIIEFKSSADELNLDVYMKVIGYACLYKAHERCVNDIMPEDITLSFVRESYPRELFKWFMDKNYVVEKPYRGIYYIVKEGFFATQVIIIKELDKKNHAFLTAITRKMDKEDVHRLAELVANLTDKEDKDNADAVLQVAIQANYQLFDMLKEADDTMCDALREFFKDELQEATKKGIETGTAEDIIELLKDIGEVPEELIEVVHGQKNLEVLRRWLKLAARSGSIEEFETGVGLVK